MSNLLAIGRTGRAAALRRAAWLAIALLAGGASKALADPPGYYFQELAQLGPTQPETTRGMIAPIKSNPWERQTATMGENDRSISAMVQCRLGPVSTSAK